MGPIIDLTSLFPWRMVYLLVQSFTCYNISHGCLKDKKHPVFTFLLILVGRIISSSIFYNNAEINILGYPTFAFLFLLILILMTEGSLLNKILVTVFQLIVVFLSAIIMSLLSAVVYQGKDYDEIFGANNPNLQHLYMYLINCVIIIVMGYLFAGFLRLIKVKKTQAAKKNSVLFAYLTFFPVSHIFVIVFALFAAPKDYENVPDFGTTVNVVVLFLMGAIIVFDCFYPFIIDKFEKLSFENEQKEKMLIKNKLEYQQIKMLIEEKDEFRKLKHDFSNLLSTTKGFIEIGKPEKALEIIKATQKDIDEISGVPISSNETVNTVLFIKQQEAKKLGIDFEINIDETAFLKVDDYSVCRIMHNMIDNAINAASQTINKYIKLDIKINEDKFIIECRNSYTNTQKKNDSKDHGHGINIIKEIAKKYSGEYSYDKKDDCYISKTEFKNFLLT